MAIQTPLVSIIMQAFKQAEFIADAIESVIRQTYPNWELIIVDDGSPDNVREIVEEYARLDNRIKFHHSANNGVSAARNLGIKNSSGEFLLPLDADDKIHKEYIKKCVDRFLAFPETKLVYSKWKLFGKHNSHSNLKYRDYKSLLVQNSIFNGAMFRRSDFDQTGGYDENMKISLEDWEFLIRLLNTESVVYQIPKTLFFYRIKEVSRNNESHDNYHSQDYIFEKHKTLYQRFWGSQMKSYIEASIFKKKYYNIWYKRLWYKYIVKKHLDMYK